MGRYIDDILQPGEKVLYSSSLHWVIYARAIAAWIVAVALLVLPQMTLNANLIMFCLAAAVVVALVGLYWAVRSWFRRWTTETDVTNLRVVHKTGFIKRDTFEISLDKIESVDVAQGLWGRILNFGNVKILGVGDGHKLIQTIASPLAFRNYITAR